MERERLPRDPNSKSPFYNPVKEDYRRSPENLERLKKQGFQKGHPHYGGRKPIPEEIKTKLGDMTEEALERLQELMYSEKDAVALMAVSKIIDPFVAKAARKLEISHEHSVSDLLQLVNAKRQGHTAALTDETPIIDVTLNEEDDED